MNRRLIGLAIFAIAALGLTGCSVTINPSEANQQEPVQSSAPAEQKPAAEEEQPADDGQSVMAACLNLAGPLAETSQGMSKVDINSSDPQSAVDMWTKLADGFGKASTSISNTEVKEAVTTVAADVSAMRDQIKKVFVDKDMGAMGDYTQAAADMQKSYLALMTLCTP